jgi:hypothetical protein
MSTADANKITREQAGDFIAGFLAEKFDINRITPPVYRRFPCKMTRMDEASRRFTNLREANLDHHAR